MADAGSLLLQVFVALSFVLLVIIKKDALWLVACALFVFASVAVRFSVDVDMVRDFVPYYESFLSVKYGYISPDLLIEPYRLILFQSVLAFGGESSFNQIQTIYYVHFTIVTAFFIWLAYRRDVSFEVKLVLFLAFYPAIAFVWIRAGMAYVAACFLIYTFTRGRWSALHFLLPAVHISTVPILLVTWVKNVTPVRKGLIVVFVAVLALFMLESNYANYVINKWTRYTETGSQRDSINLLLLHVFNILLFIYFAVINSKFRKNFAVLLTMGTYVVLYSFNPVIGLRIFPFVLIACIVERISFNRYRPLTLAIILCLFPVYFFRFEQILL